MPLRLARARRVYRAWCMWITRLMIANLGVAAVSGSRLPLVGPRL